MKRKKIYGYVSTLFALGLLLGCTKDLLTDATENDDSDSSRREAFFSLIVAAFDGNAGSRAVSSPTPGENGDGSLTGTADENAVADLNVFFFDAGDDGTGFRPGINADAETAVATPVFTFYTDELTAVTLSDGTKGYTTGSRKVTEMDLELEIGKTYDVLVLANYGQKYKPSDGSDLTLAALRSSTIGMDIPLYSTTTGNLLMTSASAGDTITVKGNTAMNPTTVSVTLERLAARVDYRVQSGYLALGSAGADKGEYDKVAITHAVLCNNYTGQEYLFKCVSPRILSIRDWNLMIPIYLGDEMTNANGIANNYVLTPDMTAGRFAEDHFETATYYPYFSPNPDATYDYWQRLTPQNSDVTAYDQYYTLTYTRENTSRTEDLTDLSKSAACVVFRAEYTPYGMESSKDKTFYWYDNKAYATLEDITKANPELNGINDTEEDLKKHNIRKYPDGVCFYTYYIRHADDGDSKTESPMEHATVRNNVYRLDVQSIYGPGGAGDIVVSVSIAPWGKTIDVYPDF